jgi:hypothetical protein
MGRGSSHKGRRIVITDDFDTSSSDDEDSADCEDADSLTDFVVPHTDSEFSESGSDDSNVNADADSEDTLSDIEIPDSDDENGFIVKKILRKKQALCARKCEYATRALAARSHATPDAIDESAVSADDEKEFEVEAYECDELHREALLEPITDYGSWQSSHMRHMRWNLAAMDVIFDNFLMCGMWVGTHDRPEKGDLVWKPGYCFCRTAITVHARIRFGPNVYIIGQDCLQKYFGANRLRQCSTCPNRHQVEGSDFCGQCVRKVVHV